MNALSQYRRPQRRRREVPRYLAFMFLLGALACADVGTESGTNRANTSSPKSDQVDLTDIERANEFFLTQIYDEQWNAAGVASDETSNNCGPSSFAMVMRERGIWDPADSAQFAIDRARAMMYEQWPDIDGSSLPKGASIYDVDGVVCVEDSSQSVFLEPVDGLPSISQAVSNAGSTASLAYSWEDVDAALEQHGAGIAFGHITQAWADRFSEDYAGFGSGAIAHFIALFPATSTDHYIVCDPMHRAGPVILSRGQLTTFFKSPINVFETSIRFLSFAPPEAPSE